MMRAVFIPVFAVVLAATPGGANGAPPTPAPPPEAESRMATFALAAGETVKITIFNVPEMTGEYMIGTGGEVTLPLVGEIKAAGIKASALSDAIRAKLATGYIRDPKVTVEVIRHRPFYILGEVNRPGEFPYAANMTVEQAVAAAGGYTYRAARRKAFLRHAGGREQIVRFGTEPVYVLPGDTIRIGERYL